MKPAVLILGATGTVGRAAVKAAAGAGWPVVAVARDARGLAALEVQYPDAILRTIEASLVNDAGALALVASLREIGQPFLGVVAALGGGDVRGRLIDQSSDELRRNFDEAVLPHLVAARHLLPWLAESGRNCGYVMVGGPGGRNPWAGYGHRSISAAALRMLARVLHDEARTHAVRLQLLEVESPARTDANEKHACQGWPCVDHIGRKALELLKHRNDARCTQAILTLEPDNAAQSAQIPSQETAGAASALQARCAKDVHRLLDAAASKFPTSPIAANRNQERTR
ncbi:MAG: SDR family NAD(P)-dependent oxidoreductase [Proteobacteria bacterium]|nr:SDR family NAD(P)-dependent oxidoreductase [Pseudomonadota bacterium]